MVTLTTGLSMDTESRQKKLNELAENYYDQLKRWSDASGEGMPGGTNETEDSKLYFERYEASCRRHAYEVGLMAGLTADEISAAIDLYRPNKP